MNTLDVKIEKLVYGGEGLGHAEGRAVFVPDVLPGEEVRIEPTQITKKLVRGRAREVLTPSPARTVPACPHFGICGGCHYQHIPYELQLQYKAEILRETLRRIGKVEWNGPIDLHASPPLAYRNRAQWKVRPAGESAPAQIGYFGERTSTLVPIHACPILSPRLADVLKSLGELLAANELPAEINEVEAFVNNEDSQLLLNVALRSARTPSSQISKLFRSRFPDVESFLLHDASRDQFELDGPGFLSYSAAGNRLRVGHLSFFQINRFLIDDLAGRVVGDSAGKFAVDLFAGVGLFTLPLARKFDRVVAVDANPAGVRDLRANLKANGLSALSLEQQVESYLGQLRETPDLVVLDPPRAGVGLRVVSRLRALGPPQIVYLACDPSTLARDLASLTGTLESHSPYRISDVHLFDMFPQTYHIETLVHLERCG